MALGDRIGRTRRQPKTQQVDRSDLFDDEFLRQLELLQVIARRLIRGRQRAEPPANAARPRARRRDHAFSFGLGRRVLQLVLHLCFGRRHYPAILECRL